ENPHPCPSPEHRRRGCRSRACGLRAGGILAAMRSHIFPARLGIVVGVLLGAIARGNAEPSAPDAAAAPFHVTLSVDAARPIGPMRPIWRFFGADEPNYAYMPGGSKLLKELGQLGA